jgi:uncharacterized membrane protein YfcA
MELSVFVISLLAGFVSGLLGLGGAVVLIPLLLTLPSILGVGQIPILIITGLSAIQVLTSTSVGFLTHRHHHFIHYPSLFYIGLPLSVFSFVGAYSSKFINPSILLMIFALLLIISLFLLLKIRYPNDKNISLKKINHPPVQAGITGGLIGFASGAVGLGGGVILNPFMAGYLKLPFKIAIGTGSGIIIMGSCFSALGKIITFQVDYNLLLPVLFGSIISAWFGAQLAKMLPPAIIKRIFVLIIFASLFQVLAKLS